MNGPDHYRNAEQLLAKADRYASSDWPMETGETKADIIAAAQAHATLANAAATALLAVTDARRPGGALVPLDEVPAGLYDWAVAAQ